jgi:hypothetical protein
LDAVYKHNVYSILQPTITRTTYPFAGKCKTSSLCPILKIRTDKHIVNECGPCSGTQRKSSIHIDLENEITVQIRLKERHFRICLKRKNVRSYPF